MSKRLQLDVTRMMADAVGPDYGATRQEIEKAWPRVSAMLQGLEAKRKAGELPFYDLPDNRESVEKIEEYASKVHGKFRNVVVLGIGGSALGPIALRDALKPLEWNSRPDELRDGPRLFVPDNPDPEFLGAVLDICEPAETLYNVITKSGGTAETVSAFLVVLNQVREQLGEEYHDHLVFTTDPAKGNLRQIARNEGITTFSIPPGVGGRFSVLTPVGLLPAALVGIDIRELLAGAAEQRETVFKRKFEENPSAAFALLQFLAHTVRKQPIQVMMPYANALFRTADWFRQLWAESLGKKVNLRGETVHTGPTPVAALGATDQHSQVQLYVEGPPDKTVTFVIPGKYRRSLRAGKHYPDIEGIDFLAGEDIGDLLRIEAEATQRALTAAHRPNMAFHMEEIAPDTVGGLMYLLEAATLVAGGLYEVNPLDQPGVEAGKIATYALLGRAGYEDIRAEIEKDRERPATLIG
ncbi:MAG TPA: glucose-6-phosphate isomerase [Bacteroidetes bacterium]|nr:glucose-6-phosphate isomerase [Bacteroidota bacterium]